MAHPRLRPSALTYTDAGYGSLTFCAPTSSSHYCDRVYQDFEAVDAAAPIPPPPSQKLSQLLAIWPRRLSTHARLVRRAGSNMTFDITMEVLFPQGYGANKTAFGMWETGSEAIVEFVVDEKGLGALYVTLCKARMDILRDLSHFLRAAKTLPAHSPLRQGQSAEYVEWAKKVAEYLDQPAFDEVLARMEELGFGMNPDLILEPDLSH
ncbi:hypothetical protein PUNSTDRAFT_145289 [Punctularia strigosozonata HHB-11173 SS5]|uniref:uncharacterized protein n=1 Tax=Punctularia strigosozonata (strain HHB-11173) TaxID=741275 RepID=UPI0004418111|nr:uncharacterized protein PUNSTDRAFT_145289 [Punctularia strigosozonata HHB-11173 SS5]EIN06813.1 hypothetical protein PUNSTDRAFT_145289 [Punctularia strigosozonata HHB-11173 SS5]